MTAKNTLIGETQDLIPKNISEIKPHHVEILKKDQAAFGRLVSGNMRFLDKIVHSIKGIDSETMLDLRQEAMIALWNALFSFKTTGGASFSTFAWRCVYNHIMGKYRNSTRKVQAHESSIESWRMREKTGISLSDGYHEEFWEPLQGKTSMSVEDEVISRVDREAQIAKLSPTDRMILECKLSPIPMKRKEIADKIGMNHNTFRFYYSVSFVKKMTAIFGENFDESRISARQQKMDSYLKSSRKKRKK